MESGVTDVGCRRKHGKADLQRTIGDRKDQCHVRRVGSHWVVRLGMGLLRGGEVESRVNSVPAALDWVTSARTSEARDAPPSWGQLSLNLTLPTQHPDSNCGSDRVAAIGGG